MPGEAETLAGAIDLSLPAPEVEQALLDLAVLRGAAAAVWQPPPGLVVPPSYRRHEHFEPLCARFADLGWPVAVRRSGGGLVPQGAGMLNLSLAWRTRAVIGEAMEPVYRRLCGLVQSALRDFGIGTDCAEVEGSFCDGRFNLALGRRKVAGTAQSWRRLEGAGHVVLAHACLLVEADLAALNERANAFEAQLGSGRQYRVEALANLVEDRAQPPRNAEGRPLDTEGLARALQALIGDGLELC